VSAATAAATALPGGGNPITAICSGARTTSAPCTQDIDTAGRGRTIAAVTTRQACATARASTAIEWRPTRTVATGTRCGVRAAGYRAGIPTLRPGCGGREDSDRRDCKAGHRDADQRRRAQQPAAKAAIVTRPRPRPILTCDHSCSPKPPHHEQACPEHISPERESTEPRPRPYSGDEEAGTPARLLLVSQRPQLRVRRKLLQGSNEDLWSAYQRTGKTNRDNLTSRAARDADVRPRLPLKVDDVLGMPKLTETIDRSFH
jgi:hypothetical protein